MSATPLELDAVVEQLVADMEVRWRQGERLLIEDYLARHPELRQAPEAILELISSEIILRQESGETPVEADLVQRFPEWGQQVRTLLECHEILAAGPAPALFPSVGESLGEFDLLAELGRGSHSQVFLASQPALANRLVVLKLGSCAGQEHLSLARLQHTHIVPLYSVHDFPESSLRGLCQPYFGGATLAKVLAALQTRPPAQRSGRDLLEALRQAQPVVPGAAPVDGPACRYLAQASYVEAVCWLGACLADALQYAGERGLLHLDLKASNVLLAADGQPMLLDFHLARAPLSAGAIAPSWLGGTPGCMAPEHQAALVAVAEGRPLPADVDSRADIYSLALLLCEMLGMSRPRASGPCSRGLADLLARCLADDPAERYPTPASLAADLRRHMANLPLRGVPNRSLTERWRKWRGRRPHALLILLLLLGAGLGMGFLIARWNRQTQQVRSALEEGQEHLNRSRYQEALESFRHGSTLAEDLPFSGELHRQVEDQLQRATQARAVAELHAFCERIRPLYGVEQLPADQARAVAGHCLEFWRKRDEICQRLRDQADAKLWNQLRGDLLDLAILQTQLQVRLASADRVLAARREALDMLAEAEELFGPSSVLYLERRIHARALGLTREAAEADHRAESMLPASGWEHYALGRSHFLSGDSKRALAELDRAIEMQPAALWPWFYRGCCACTLNQFEDAVVAFSICQVLSPDSAWCYHNRGLAHAALGRLDRALRDFDRALALDPSLSAAALERGVLHYRKNRLDYALADLLQARRNGLDSASLHCNLALVQLAQEDRTAAQESIRAALKRDPNHQNARQLLLRLQQDQ